MTAPRPLPETALPPPILHPRVCSPLPSAHFVAIAVPTLIPDSAAPSTLPSRAGMA